MVLPRTSAFGSIFRSSAARTSRLRSTSQTWRTAGRRGYASDHGHAKKSSDLPWLIGSVVVTVPSAAWLWQQGPKKGDHGHGRGHGEHEEHKEGEEGEEEPKEEGGEDAKDEGSDESKEEGEEKSTDDAEAKSDEGAKDDSGDKDDSSDDSRSDDSEKAGTPDTSDDDAPDGQVKKGKGEKQKGETRQRTETKGEKDAAKDTSGASNPYMHSPEKSKKGEGVTDTAKIHGTVDPQRNVRGPGDGEQPQTENQDKGIKDKPSSVQA